HKQGLSRLAHADLQARPDIAAILHDRHEVEPLIRASRQVAPGIMRQAARTRDVSDDAEVLRYGWIKPAGCVQSVGDQRVIDANLNDFLEIREDAFDLLDDAGRAGQDRDAAGNDGAAHQAAASDPLVQAEDALAKP